MSEFCASSVGSFRAFFSATNWVGRAVLCVAAVWLGPQLASAAAPSLLELTQNGNQFEGKLEAVLGDLHEALWKSAA